MYYFFYQFIEDISDTICTHLFQRYGEKKIQLIEANPGPCMITQNILEKTNYNILLYENEPNEYLTVINYLMIF